MNAAATESSPDISPRHLRAVLAVTEYRSFIAAAAYLKISQSALTRTIKQAETALGVTLYSRSTRQVTVTPAGKEFTAVAERLLNDLTISVGSIRQHAQHTTGQVVVASVYSLAPCMASATMAPFRSRYPGVQLHLREGIHRERRGRGTQRRSGFWHRLPRVLAERPTRRKPRHRTVCGGIALRSRAGTYEAYRSRGAQAGDPSLLRGRLADATLRRRSDDSEGFCVALRGDCESTADAARPRAPRPRYHDPSIARVSGSRGSHAYVAASGRGTPVVSHRPPPLA